MIVRTLLIAYLIGLVRSDDLDNLVEDVLGKPKDESCTCVPFYQCRDGKINTDGTGIISLRMGTICKDYIEVCCKTPTEEIILPKHIERKGCGQRHPDGVGFKVTENNNNEAQFGEFPWMVALLSPILQDDDQEQLKYICGGALIHKKVVLTTAHCTTKKNNDSYMIARAGEWDTQRINEIFSYQDRMVDQIIIHPEFNGGNLWNDFALLVVDKPYEFAPNVDILCLPPPRFVSLSRECYATGWGNKQFGQKDEYQVILKKIDLPMVPNDQCVTLLRQTRLGQHFGLHESFVCAGGIVGKDTCTGDGGSPLVCPVEGNPGTYQAIGLVAWGIGCGGVTPGVYAGVAYARPWIDMNMRELGLSI